MSDLSNFKITGGTINEIQSVSDDATSTGNATQLTTINAVAPHTFIQLRTSKSSPNTTLYCKLPTGNFAGQLLTVMNYQQVYNNHTIDVINTDDVSAGSGQTNTVWFLVWADKWKVIRQVTI